MASPHEKLPTLSAAMGFSDSAGVPSAFLPYMAFQPSFMPMKTQPGPSSFNFPNGLAFLNHVCDRRFPRMSTKFHFPSDFLWKHPQPPRKVSYMSLAPFPFRRGVPSG